MAIIADKIEIRIDGNTFDDYVFTDIRLSQEIQKPSELRFVMYKNTLRENAQDIRFSLSDQLLGKNVELFISTKRSDESKGINTDTLEFTGIIFNVNALRKNLKAGMLIEVIAFSPDYLLCDNPHCYSYENENLTTIVSKTLEPYKIEIQNNPRMTDNLLYTVQYNETNHAFLNRLANRFGEWLYYNGKQLVFGEIEKINVADPLHLGYDVLNYQYRMDMANQNFSHAQHNYLEYANTKNDGLSATGQSMHNMTDITYDQSLSAFTKETFQHLTVASAEESSFDETEISVKVQGLGKKAKMMVCHGSSNRADLQIGSVFKIKEDIEEGEQKNGVCMHDELMICKIVHVANYNGSYENEFSAIPASCEYPPYTYEENSPRIESQRAIVKDNADPEQLGRVRVQFLWQQEQDDSLMTPWLRISQPHGGDNKGFYFIPELEEEVIVAFENGNAEKPYVAGTLWHGQQHPGSNWPDPSNDIKAIRTRNGHTVEIHDISDGGYIRIYDNEKENYILTYSTDEKLIKMESTGNIEMYAENNIIMVAKNNINMTAGVDMNRDAGNNINETAGVDITTSAGSNISTTAGNNISTKAGDNISVKAGNDMDTSVGNNDTLYVSSNQFIEIGSHKDETIEEQYQLNAENIRVEASDKVLIYSQTNEQKSDQEMKLDGGNSMDLYANIIKIN